MLSLVLGIIINIICIFFLVAFGYPIIMFLISDGLEIREPNWKKNQWDEFYGPRRKFNA
jgi:hypothetical protein